MAAAATAALIAGSVAAGATPVASVGKTGADGHVASASPHRIGTAPHLPKGAVRIGATSASTSVQLSVGLVPRNPQELKDFIAATTTKGNAQYHHYLAKGQFASVFGPTPATIAKVTASLKAEGLKPGKVSSDGLSIPVTTTVATATHAFGTHFTSYKLPGGVTGFANSAAPLVSGSIAADVSGITGLNTVARHQTMHTVVPPTSSTSAATSTPASGSSAVVQHSAVTPVPSGPQLCGSAVTALGKTYKGSSDGKGYISAGSLAATYGMSHTSTSGAGITVGVFEMENYSTKDLAAYQSCYGTKVSVTRRTVDGGPKEAVNPAKIGGTVTGNGIESLLDLEDIASLAPGAKIIAYQGVDLDKATNTNWLHTFQAMVTDDAASVLSMSYGGCEDDSDYSVIVAEEYYSAEAAAQGQTILASSGDDGATDCYEDSGSPNTLAASVDDPASQPYVTGVGGTTLTNGGTDTAAATSAAWSGSGGGTSVVWSLPSGNDYQSGFEADGYDGDGCDAASGYNCRQVPDVAANANPKSGYPVYYGGAWHLVGGTSGASPTWAALLAIANTQSACRSNGPLGMINFALYQVARDNYAANFRDVTTGTNKAVQGLGYNATTGYDLPTGLGEPKAAALSAALCATVPAPAKGPSTFHTVAPTRLLDTRSSSTPLPAGDVSGVQIEGNPALPGIPTSGVTAVVLDMSVTKTSGTGVLTAWGDGTPRPKTSNLNWAKGQTVSNLVTVAVPGDGWVDFYNNSPTQVIADIQGYYTDDTSGQTYTSLPKGSQRLLDTRTKNKKPLSDTTLSLPITSGTDPLAIPADATAVVLNLTAVSTVNSGHLTAWAEKSGSTPPSSVYNVSWTGSGVTQAGLSVVPIGADGNVSVQIAGTSQVIADVFGYYTPDSTGKVFNTTKPTRILDTRSAVGVSTKSLIPSGHIIKLQVTGGSLPVPAGAAAVVLNVTAADVTKAGVLSVWADGAATPTATNLNWWAKNQAMPNQVIVPIGADGKIDLKVSSSSAAVIADVFGYFN